MNILVALNSNYVGPLTVMLSSIMNSNPGEKFAVYVAHSSLTDNNFARIRASVETDRCRIVPVRVPDNLLADAPVLKRISKETYYRLLAMDFLPESVEKILYLDPDIVVINPLRSIYDIELGDNLLAGASHISEFLKKCNRRRLEMPNDSCYVNAGVLLMNISGLRNTVHSKDIFDFINSAPKSKLYLADQDVINALFGAKTVEADPRIFNLDEKTYKTMCSGLGIKWVKNNTVIVHFNGKYKPWKKGYKGSLDGFYFVEKHRLESVNRHGYTRVIPA